MSVYDGIRIHHDPRIFGGRPTIGNHRVTVHDVVSLFKDGAPVGDIATDFDLSEEEVQAALAYYQRHSRQIDAELIEDCRIISELANRDQSPAAQRLRAAWNERSSARHG